MTAPPGGAGARRHVALIGLMGAGKSTVGPLVAARLARPFVDTDELVEATAGRAVAEIFASDGEEAFRVLERAALADACASPEPLVVSCGGGAVLDPQNRRVLRRTGVVVWLRAGPEQLAARVADSGDRPLLADAAPVDALRRLEALRGAAYEAAADVAVDTGALTPDAVADRVVEEVASCVA